MIHPHTELHFISNEIGYGVVATQFIPAGTITWILDELDREFLPAQHDKMNYLYKNILDTYTFRNNKGNMILCWDLGRFVNHSFNSNCLTTAYDFEIAIRDIQPGEQLTDDYGYLNISEPFDAMDEGNDRKTVYPDDLVRYYELWDQKIEKVFNKITNLEQPLKPLMKDALWNKVNSIIKGSERIDSILTNYYDPAK
ncbi:SET domain-containing protein [Nonlabens antarcticus]|uniref:SET domain-containing protein n=1 Tax=Nonlabens antarcticus TaxID=392714 RepID=UPI00189138BE|nr:SET domain-containing protein [Nonlabens antarcticus]